MFPPSSELGNTRRQAARSQAARSSFARGGLPFWDKQCGSWKQKIGRTPLARETRHEIGHRQLSLSVRVTDLLFFLVASKKKHAMIARPFERPWSTGEAPINRKKEGGLDRDGWSRVLSCERLGSHPGQVKGLGEGFWRTSGNGAGR